MNTFLFADLSGFTELTEELGDDHAADVAMAFCAALNEQLPDDAEDVKMLGDSCLVRVANASEAISLGVDLTTDLAPDRGLPEVRVGMHTGSAVQREGDWFGSGVNIAARVVALARPGEVILTQDTRDAVGANGLSFEDRGDHDLRHVGRTLRLYRAKPWDVGGQR